MLRASSLLQSLRRFVPVRSRPFRLKKSSSFEKTGKFFVDRFRVRPHSRTAESRYTPYPLPHPGQQSAKALFQYSPASVPVVGFPLPFSHGHPDPGTSVLRLHKQQPHQYASQPITGAEDTIELPPSSKARRPRKKKSQGLHGQPGATLSPAIAENTTACGRTRPGEETHLSFSRSVMGLERLLHQ